MPELGGYDAAGPIATVTMDDGNVNVMSSAMLTRCTPPSIARNATRRSSC